MRKWSVYFLFILLNLPLQSWGNFTSSSISSCGLYHVGGTIKKDEEHILKFVVNEGSKSEYQFTIKSGELAAFAGYLEQMMSFDVTIEKLDGTRGVISTPSNFKHLYPNPLFPLSVSGFNLIKKSECVK